MENGENLPNIRHTLAHLLAAAAITKWPEAKLTLGPAIDNGFYYDIDFGNNKVSENDLEYLESKMREILPSWTEFTHKVVSQDEALELFSGNEYKTELINEIVGRGEEITLYTCGDFTDLCRGGHAENPAKEIKSDSFKLDRVAGAYWRGDEKNKMLTRIYGLAFNTKEELDAYTEMIEEARKRDHKKIGKELGLFTFSPLVGSGLPLWTPKGTIVRELLNDYVWSLRKKHGYQKVCIPHITKKDLYEKSGHWAKYSDDLFRIETRENHLYAMKPMNCPHHTQIFDSEPKSYRDMPQRYAETTMVYRDEQSGELSGLSRVLSITQDDAHVFCRENQLEEEAMRVWDIIETFYKTFGFELEVRFSRRDMENLDQYLGSSETWDKAENAIKNLINSKVDNFIDGPGEAAFYGPKIDFMAKDSIGRTWQVATIQIDFVQPKNFELSCTNEQGLKEDIVMIHCAIMGSIERFLSTYIEHTAGSFPVWLSPKQVSIVPVNNDKHLAFAEELYKKLDEQNIRTNLLDNKDSLGKKINGSKAQKVPYVIVIGDKEIESGNLTVETRDGAKSTVTIPEFIDIINKEVNDKNIDLLIK